MSKANGKFDTRASDIVFASFENVKLIRDEKQFRRFVWPEEGEMTIGGFQFNKEHAGEYEPLIIDIVTANMLVTVHDAITKEENKAKLIEWIQKSRGHFAKVVQIGWNACK